MAHFDDDLDSFMKSREKRTVKPKKEPLLQLDEDSEPEPEVEELHVPAEQEESKAKPAKDIAPVSHGGFELPGSDEHAKIWVMVGVPASGKSYMLRYIMYLYGKRRHFKGGGLCFSPSAYNGDYDFLPEKALREKFDVEYLDAYIENLKKKVKEGKQKYGRDWRLPHNFLILDDCIGLLNNNSETLTQLWGCHRQTSTTVFILTQYLAAQRSVSTLLRNITNFALMWPQTLKNSIESMYNSYGQMFDNLEEFRGALNQARQEKYSCLVYMNSVDITRKEDAYKIIKAGRLPEFKLVFGKQQELPQEEVEEEEEQQRLLQKKNTFGNRYTVFSDESDSDA